MSSAVDICNMALSHVQISTQISSLTENSQEARACNQFYDIARRETLRGYKWPFARVFNSLQLVEREPTDEWQYSYRYPVDCLNLIRIRSYTRNDNRQSRVSFDIVSDDTGRLLYTDKEDAEVEYIRDIKTGFTDDFTLALSYKVGYYIAPRVSTGDTNSLRRNLFAYYEDQIQKTRNNASNEEQEDERPLPLYVRARSSRYGLGPYYDRGTSNVISANRAGIDIL